MRAEIKTDLLWRLMNATPEQYAAVERILGCQAESGKQKREMESVREDGGSATGESSTTAPRYLFRRAGSHWDVLLHGGERFHVEDSAGARYAHFMLRRPGEVISAFDLEVAICPEKANARSRDSIQTQLDPETVRSYLRELARLRGEREAAVERGDLARGEQLDEEIAAVEGALHASGRETGDAGERARNNVRKAVGSFIRRLNRGGKAEQAFAAYLTQCLSLGFEVMYRPMGKEVWE